MEQLLFEETGGMPFDFREDLDVLRNQHDEEMDLVAQMETLFAKIRASFENLPKDFKTENNFEWRERIILTNNEISDLIAPIQEAHDKIHALRGERHEKLIHIDVKVGNFISQFTNKFNDIYPNKSNAMKGVVNLLSHYSSTAHDQVQKRKWDIMDCTYKAALEIHKFNSDVIKKFDELIEKGNASNEELNQKIAQIEQERAEEITKMKDLHNSHKIKALMK